MSDKAPPNHVADLLVIFALVLEGLAWLAGLISPFWLALPEFDFQNLLIVGAIAAIVGDALFMAARRLGARGTAIRVSSIQYFALTAALAVAILCFAFAGLCSLYSLLMVGLISDSGGGQHITLAAWWYNTFATVICPIIIAASLIYTRAWLRPAPAP